MTYASVWKPEGEPGARSTCMLRLTAITSSSWQFPAPAAHDVLGVVHDHPSADVHVVPGVAVVLPPSSVYVKIGVVLLIMLAMVTNRRGAFVVYVHAVPVDPVIGQLLGSAAVSVMVKT
jgi:hypothetical protein